MLQLAVIVKILFMTGRGIKLEVLLIIIESLETKHEAIQFS